MQKNKDTSTVKMHTTNTTSKSIQYNRPNGIKNMANLKQNLLKTKQNTEHIGDLDNKERCLYTYFSLGNNYN